MRIPEGAKDTAAEGKPTLRTQHIRTYGAGGFRMDDQEEVQGCPRQYREKYVTHSVVAEKRSDALTYGTMMHNVLYVMEEEAIGPEEALERHWPSELSVDRWAEAVADLEAYLERGGPMARLGTLQVETDLWALLYVDEEFGEVWFGGRLDWLGVDVNEMATLHVVDYKTNRFPPSREDVEKDVQLMSYAWLARENWSALGMQGSTPNVVVHLDAVKWKEIEWRYTDEQLEQWRDWAIAIARRILRDQKAEPRLGPGCAWCPIKADCPAFKKLPGQGLSLAERRSVASLEERLAWRDEAKAAIKALNAGVEEVDAAVEEAVDAAGGRLVIGRNVHRRTEAWSNVVAKDRLFELLGRSRYLGVSSVTKKAAERLLADGGTEELKALVWGCWSREVTGSKVEVIPVEREESS